MEKNLILETIKNNINIIYKKIKFDNSKQDNEMILKLKKIFNNINTRLSQIKFNQNNFLINYEDIIEIQNIYLSEINKTENDYIIIKDNFEQYINNLNILLENSLTNSSPDNNNANTTIITKEKKKEKEDAGKKDEANKNKRKKTSSKNKEKVKVKNDNKIKNNNDDKSESEDTEIKIGKIKTKRVFENTDNSIKGEYNIIENDKKRGKKAYNFCYENNNIITKFLFKNNSKNKEFYTCYKAGKGCPGKAMYVINEDIFRVYVECNFNIKHENITFEKFEIMYNNNKLNEINMNIKKYQRYYFRYLFKNNISQDKFDAVDNFKARFGKNITLTLTDLDINYEKSNNTLKPKDKNILELINYLENEIEDIKIKKIDITYDYKYYDKDEKSYKNKTREEEIIFFGTVNMLNQLVDENNVQYFIDLTYKIIPPKYHPYRLLTIKAFNKITKNTKLCLLIALKYEDENSLYYTFKYLKEFYKFNPKLVNIDFSIPLYNALAKKNLFDKNIKIITCFFHYSQSIVRKMKTLKLLKKI